MAMELAYSEPEMAVALTTAMAAAFTEAIELA